MRLAYSGDFTLISSSGARHTTVSTTALVIRASSPEKGECRPGIRDRSNRPVIPGGKETFRSMRPPRVRQERVLLISGFPRQHPPALASPVRDASGDACAPSLFSPRPGAGPEQALNRLLHLRLHHLADDCDETSASRHRRP